MVIHWASLLLGIVSIAVIGVLIGVLTIQQVHGHIKAVKTLLIETFAAFILIDTILLVRRVALPDAMATIVFDKLIYTISLFALALIGHVATIIYIKPKSSTWTGIYKEIARGGKIFVSFLLFISIIISFIILIWFAPIRAELAECYPHLYVPSREIQTTMAPNVTLIIFLLYPVTLFLLAGYAAENKTVSRDLRIFAICIIGLGLSNYLQAFFVSICLAEVLEIVQIPCFIAITYVFRRITALQSFQEVELREYMARLGQRKR